ncbi:MAG: matrixin family metalloprotease [Pirellulales bacterium]
MAGTDRGRTRRSRYETLEPRMLLHAAAGREWASTDVSVSLLPDGTSTDGYTSSLYAELDAAAPRAAWQREFARALQTWANVSNLDFHFVSDGGSPTGSPGRAQGDSRFGDIRLGAHPLDRFVAYAYYPSGTTRGGDITLNSNSNFSLGKHIDLYSVLLHETGHALGLGHGTAGTMMYATIKGVYSGLAAADIAGVQGIYGARAHDSFDTVAANDTFRTASTLALSSGAVEVSADLTTLADVDYYRVRLPEGAEGTLTVSVDAGGISLLSPKLSVYDGAGRRLAVADAGGQYGGKASITLKGLPAGQTVYLVADGAVNDVFGMGTYRLNAEFVLDRGPAPIDSTPSAVVSYASAHDAGSRVTVEDGGTTSEPAPQQPRPVDSASQAAQPASPLQALVESLEVGSTSATTRQARLKIFAEIAQLNADWFELV